MKRLVALAALLAALPFAALPLAAEPLRVLTFNVRYPNPNDGADAWPARRDLLVATVRHLAPDIMGTQELFHEQGEYIVEKLPEYKWFGLSRRGNQADEHMGVFYRHAKLRVIDSGDFWLSETPDTPGSMSWNVSLPRMVTWAQFETVPGGRRFYYGNTHFAHRGEDGEARRRSAALIVSRIQHLTPDAPLILTGDFNTGAGTEPYQLLTKPLRDAWKEAAAREGPEGTFHGFRGKPGNTRIDWILVRGPWKVTRAETVTRNDNGRYPSDHFPVLADLDW